MNSVILVTADKGRTIVSIDDTAYTEKVTDFLNNNQFSTLTKELTDKYKKQLQQILRQCNKIIDKPKIRKLMQDKPKPPILKVQLKLHKPDIPIRPVIDNIHAST
jgi:hypothetical protein